MLQPAFQVELIVRREVHRLAGSSKKPTPGRRMVDPGGLSSPGRRFKELEDAPVPAYPVASNCPFIRNRGSRQNFRREFRNYSSRSTLPDLNLSPIPATKNSTRPQRDQASISRSS